jgi:Tfp pilus assembly protein PilX
MNRSHSEDGFALVSAIVLLMVILGLGMGLLLFTDNQQRASRIEQSGESSFNVAEAALNAQIGQVSRVWPTKAAETSEAPKAGCTETTSTTTNGCPTSASMSTGYPNISPVPCAANATKDAWGSPVTNQWTTYVRDNASGSLYSSGAENTALNYDANGDGKVWVRAVGVVQCHVVSVVTLVSRQLVALSFPKDAVSGNWFKVTNSGNKKIVLLNNANGGEGGDIGMRCEGVTTCEEWDQSKEQIYPDRTKKEPVPSPIMNEEQLQAMRSQAISLGTFRSPTVKGCPTKIEELSGLPAYVEGCGKLKMTGNGVANSEASPGFLVLADGTLSLEGSSTFYGVIYAHNAQESSGVVVSLGGTTEVVGAIDVDGKGGIEFGASKVNFVYNSKAIEEIKAYAGATPTRNTFRVLPGGQ